MVRGTFTVLPHPLLALVRVNSGLSQKNIIYAPTLGGHTNAIPSKPRLKWAYDW